MRSILILLGAAGAMALPGAAQAQVIGGGVSGGLGAPVGGVTGSVTGRVTGPDLGDTVQRGTETSRRTVKRAKDKAGATVERARGAADEASDASARAAGQVRAGAAVRDSSGAMIGKVLSADGSGYVRIQTRSGVVTLPSAALRMDGGVAVSSQTEAEMHASGSVRTN